MKRKYKINKRKIALIGRVNRGGTSIVKIDSSIACFVIEFMLNTITQRMSWVIEFQQSVTIH